MRNTCVTIYSASDVASGNGDKIDANQLVSASFQVRISDADFAGSIKIQASNDPTLGVPRANFTPTNWSDIPNAAVTVTAGPVLSAGIILIPNMAFSWIRAVVTQTTPGSGTATVNMNALGI